MEQITAKEMTREAFIRVWLGSKREWSEENKDRMREDLDAVINFHALRSVSETKEDNYKGLWEQGCVIITELQRQIEKLEKQISVPVSEVGQMEKVEGRLEQALLYLRGNVSKENIAEATIHIQKAISLLPVSNTKKVEGEDIKKQKERMMILFEAVKLKAIGKKEFSEEVDKILSSLRSNDQEGEGKIIADNAKILNETYDFLKGLAKSSMQSGANRYVVDGIDEMAAKIKSLTVPSRPLKALSEITDEHYIEVAKILGFEDNLLWHGKTSLPRITNELDPLGKPIEYSGYAHLKVIKAFQYLSQFYAVPVFYPVPEVKEKGESTK